MAFSLKSLFGGKRRKSGGAGDYEHVAGYAVEESLSPMTDEDLAGFGEVEDPKKKKKKSKGLVASLMGMLPLGKTSKKKKAEDDPFDDPELMAAIAAAVAPKGGADKVILPDPFESTGGGAPSKALPISRGPDIPSMDDLAAGFEGDPDAMPAFTGLAAYDPDAEAERLYQAQQRKKKLVASALAVVVLLVLGGGGAWLFLGGSEDDDVAGLIVSSEERPAGAGPGQNQQAPPVEPASGDRISMALPPPPSLAPPSPSPSQQAGAEAEATPETERSLSRRPWLVETAEAPPGGELGEGESGNGADDPAPPEEGPLPEGGDPTPPPLTEGETPDEAPTGDTPPPVSPEAAPVQETPASETQLAALPRAGLPTLEDPPAPSMASPERNVPAFASLTAPAGARPQALPQAPLAEVARATPAGILPVRGSNLTPWQAYRRPFEAPPDLARVAIVITGLGMNPDATAAAIEKLPPDVTLSFSPYAPTLAQQMDTARRSGHEVMLDLAMQPDAYPVQDPGPLTLLTLLSENENLGRLHDVMIRGVGYTGFIGRFGGAFGQSVEHMTPVLREIAGRGLLYVHDTGQGSLTVPADASLPLGRVLIQVDERGFRDSIAARLTYLEEVAKANGATIAMARPLPVTFEAIATWAADLRSRGVVLAPVSAVVGE